MSKNKASVPTVKQIELSGESFGQVDDLLRNYTRRLVGETMQMIETLGLQDRQEEAFKNVVKKNFYVSLDDERKVLQWYAEKGFKEWSASGVASGPVSMESAI